MTATRETHPSFGTLTLMHNQGQQHLYGSELLNHHALTLSLYASERVTQDGRVQCRPTGQPMVRVRLSTVQWAELITTIGSSGGVPCTIHSLNSEPVEPYAHPTPPAYERFEQQAQERAQAAFGRVQEVQARLRETVNAQGRKQTTSLPTQDLLEMANTLDQAVAQLTSGLPFLLELFQETAAEITSNAKSELLAFIQQHQASLPGVPAPTLEMLESAETPAGRD